MSQPLTIDEFFYGSATVGERGQVVIPADARKECDFHPGEKLLVFRHPLHPHMLILAKVGEMERFLQQMAKAVEQASARYEEALSAEGAESL